MTREEIEILQAVAEIVGSIRDQAHNAKDEDQELLDRLGELEVDLHFIIARALERRGDGP